MPRLDRLSAVSRNSLLTLPVQVSDSAPFTPLQKPLAEARVALVTTAGLHRRDDQPFGPGDPSVRVFPASVTQGDLLQSHASIGFDRTFTQQDMDVVFPLDRLRELAVRGEIGDLAPNCCSCMGAQRDVSRIRNETAPAVAARLIADGAEVVLLTPT